MAQFVTPALMQLYDGSGNPYSGGRLYIYESGTTTLLELFSDVDLSTPASNPLIADSAGIFPNVFIAETLFKTVFQTASGITIKSSDPVYAIGQFDAIQASNVEFDGSSAGLSSDNVQDAIVEVAAEIDGSIQNTLMTTEGDIIIRDNIGPTRLAVGTTTQVLGVENNRPAWVNTAPYPPNYLTGLTLSNASGDTEHDISIAVGSCRDIGNAANIVLSSVLVKRIDAAWGSGTNSGGMDSGAVGNNITYGVFLIRNPATGDVDALFSTANLPSLPSGYSQYRRIGFVRTDGSANIRQFIQNGDEVLFRTPIFDVNASNVGSSRANYTLSVPPSSLAIVRHWGIPQSGGTSYILSNPDLTDVAASVTTNLSADNYATTATEMTPQRAMIRTNASSQISARFESGTTNALTISTLGYVDTRGK